jgi:ketosteroid isomerase-like protein
MSRFSVWSCARDGLVGGCQAREAVASTVPWWLRDTARAMSQENVEIVRRAMEASTRRDNEATFALYDPEVELLGPVDGAVYRGLTGVRAFFGDWFTTWDELTYDAEEWIDAGDDVIAALHVRARGRQSGVPVERREWHVWTLRDSKLWRLRIYATKPEALEAVGLSE